jgi:hypothetical protein
VSILDAEQPEHPMLPVLHGQDHAALALLPFTLALRDPAESSGPVTFEHQVNVDGRPRRTRVTLVPGESGQLPVHADQMVYLAMLQLALRRGEPEPVLAFTRYEVFELLQWPNAGRYYDKLRSSLTRLWECGLLIESAMLARDGREYNRATAARHIISDFDIGSGANAQCRVRWGDLVIEAFRLADFKRLDWSLLLALGNPLTAQLYRVLDRVTLAGYASWQVGWEELASLLGMRREGYDKPSRLRKVLLPHFERLIEQGVVAGVDYQRGGIFVFHVHNYLRVQLRRILLSLGVFDKVATQLLSAHDEAEILAQCDCLERGNRPPAKSRGGFLTEAIRGRYPLSYPPEEPQAFAAMWSILSQSERDAYHAAGLRIAGGDESLFDTHADPSAWRLEMRAVVRLLICWNLDPDEMLRPSPKTPSLLSFDSSGRGM